MSSAACCCADPVGMLRIQAAGTAWGEGPRAEVGRDESCWSIIRNRVQQKKTYGYKPDFNRLGAALLLPYSKGYQ
jgi:hypothetical protein